MRETFYSLWDNEMQCEIHNLYFCSLNFESNTSLSYRPNVYLMVSGLMVYLQQISFPAYYLIIREC